jgi:hypothetical protein
MKGGLVHRYDMRRASDGLPHGKAAFVACTCWLANNRAMQRRHDEGRALFETRVLSIRNDVGLLAEEYDVNLGAQMGNFPQALSHLAVIGTAYSLRTRGRPALGHRTPRPPWQRGCPSSRAPERGRTHGGSDWHARAFTCPTHCAHARDGELKDRTSWGIWLAFSASQSSRDPDRTRCGSEAQRKTAAR